MNILKTKTTAFLFVFSLLFAFCSKEHLEPKPQPGGNNGGGSQPLPVTESVRFAAQINLTGQPYHTSSLHALVSVVNEKGEAVLSNKQLTLSIGEVVLTEAVRLPIGQYKLTAFRLVHGGVNTRFAAPIVNSTKATQVTKPLFLEFKLQQAAPQQVPVEVLKVETNDSPASFGYPKGAFDQGQADQSPYVKVRIRAEVKVGDVLYDNTRAALSLTTYNASGERSTSYLALQPGINEVTLLKAASRFQLRVTKWGADSELLLEQGDLNRDTVYTFSLTKNPKMLASETNYKLVNGNFKPDYKKSYVYEFSGRLTEMQYIYRKQDGTNLQGITERLTYHNGRVTNVSRFDEKFQREWSTTFTYDGQSRINGIAHQQGSETTTGTVLYEGAPAASIGIQYVTTKPGYHYEQHSYRTLVNGNVLSSRATLNNHEMETGMYDYDDQINPYRFLGLPDLYLTHVSKNNVVNEYRNFVQGNSTGAVPYRSEYTYDADGYPTQVIRHYRSFSGGVSQHAYTTKTVFTYR